jgi:hypothetical protein
MHFAGACSRATPVNVVGDRARLALLVQAGLGQHHLARAAA